MGKKDLWSKNWQLIEQAPLKPIVSLGKGIEAAIYISREMIRERVGGRSRFLFLWHNL